MRRLAAIWRHPVKGIGREAMEGADLAAGAPLPGDRAWALLHDGAADIDGWQPRRNFLVVASGPRLAQVAARTEGTRIALDHPDLDPLDFNPATDGDRLAAWVRPIWPADRPAPARLVRAPAQGMADNGRATLAILNPASAAALPGDPDLRRFRGNLVIDGLAPWEEWGWIGRTIRIGDATLRVTDRIQRCRAIEASPATGERDLNLPAALRDGFGHQDFGIYAEIAHPGAIALGDAVAVGGPAEAR